MGRAAGVLRRGRDRGAVGGQRGGAGAGRRVQRGILQDEYVDAVSVGGHQRARHHSGQFQYPGWVMTRTWGNSGLFLVVLE